MVDDGVPGVEVELAGKKQLARLDTGSMGGIGISQAIADTLKFESAPVVIGQARTVSGAFEISRAQLPGDLKIGSIVMENPDVMIVGPIPVVTLGGRILRDFVVTYDQAHDRIRFIRVASD